MEDMILDDFSDIVIPEPEFYGVYDPDTGRFIKIGPEFAFVNEKYKIKIDRDLVDSIHEGTLKISSCFVDQITGSLEITEIRSLVKIDDVLHRISLKKYVKVKDIDVLLTYYKKTKKLKIELSEELGGTAKSKSKKTRKIIWDGETELNFIITDYNDPHNIHDNFKIKINELSGKSRTFTLENPPDQFSVFTKRILKNYVWEIK